MWKFRILDKVEANHNLGTGKDTTKIAKHILCALKD